MAWCSARAKQSEAKANLKAIYGAQESEFADKGTFGASFKAIDWSPEVGIRYTYYLGGDVMRADKGDVLPLPANVESYARDDAFKAVAVGNVDGDATPDIWVIDDQNMLENVVNDIER